MAFIEVHGGKKLYGEIVIQGSKNAVLPMLAASVLSKDIVKIYNCPKILDVESMLELLKAIGCSIEWTKEVLCISAAKIHNILIGEEYTKHMRSSILLLGAMLGRVGEVSIAYPGGCSIGARPIDLHLSAMRKMNIEVEELDCLINCQSRRIIGNEIMLHFPSVGATENIILCAVLAEGMTKIINCAMEPEIQELCTFLRKMGAKITGDGTNTIVIEGVKELHGISHRLMSDRIVAGTYLSAVAGTGGEAFLRMDCTHQMNEILDLLEEMGAEILRKSEGILIKSSGNLRNIGLVQTKPYPGFPTDMQSQIMAISSVAYGTTILIENVFEERFKTMDELNKMGANISFMGRAAIITGVKHLKGKNVVSPDLRGGAALVIAGLLATGITYIHNIVYINRGYEDICSQLKKLGATICYVEE